MSESLRLTLLENGLDFIRSGLRCLQVDAPGKHDLKYAVLHVCAGIELVVKERLRREHWSLVFDRVENANEKSYQTGDFSSVSFNDCLQRIIGICGVKISDRQRQRLGSFRSKRNRLEHFGILDSAEAIVAATAEALNFLLEFIHAELNPEELGGEEVALLDEIREMLGGFKAFVTERWKTARGHSKYSEGAAVTCVRCVQEAAIIDDGINCLFCGYRGEPEQAAEEYVGDVLGLSRYTTVKDGGVWPIVKCPSCDRLTLVDRGGSGSQHPQKQFICFGCGEVWKEGELDYCSSCGQPYADADEFPMCSECFEARVKADE